MSKLNGQTLLKITKLLKLPQNDRELQEVHFLSLNFKKNMICISNIINWWMLTKCIQNLQLHTQNTIMKQQIDWIFVLKGSFDFHGMIYKQGQQLSIQLRDCEYLKFQPNSLYSILTYEAKQKARKYAQQFIRFQNRQFAKSIIFGNSFISQRDLNNFWEYVKQFRLKKGQIFNVLPQEDMVFVVISGSVKINYEWRRLINLRQLGQGSIFSTYLGRYFYKTSKQFNPMEKYQFQIVGSGQENLLFGFSPDIFYEKSKYSDYKFIVQNAWKLYQKRVSETKRIISSIGMMKPQKESVKENIRQQIQVKYLRQKCVSVPVAIERRKLRKITYQIFEEKSTRRKIPNKAPSTTQSARQISNSRIQTIDRNTQQIFFQRNSYRKQAVDKNQQDKLLQKSKTEHFRKYRTRSQENITQHNNNTVSTRIKTQRRQKIVSRENQLKNNQENQQQRETLYRFFRPEQFISKKLKLHYQSVLMNAQTFKIPIDKTINIQKPKDTHKNKKQYFQQYINQRRLLKLGPKKRLLYKKAKGF